MHPSDIEAAKRLAASAPLPTRAQADRLAQLLRPVKKTTREAA